MARALAKHEPANKSGHWLASRLTLVSNGRLVPDFFKAHERQQQQQHVFLGSHAAAPAAKGPPANDDDNVVIIAIIAPRQRTL